MNSLPSLVHHQHECMLSHLQLLDSMELREAKTNSGSHCQLPCNGLPKAPNQPVAQPDQCQCTISWCVHCAQTWLGTCTVFDQVIWGSIRTLIWVVCTLSQSQTTNTTTFMSKYLPSDLLEFLKIHLHSEVSKGYSHASKVSRTFLYFQGFWKSSCTSEVSESSHASRTLETSSF